MQHFLLSDAPRIATSVTGATFGYVGGLVNLSCAAQAIPQANFSWAKEDEEILPYVKTKNDERDRLVTLESSTVRFL